MTWFYCPWAIPSRKLWLLFTQSVSTAPPPPRHVDRHTPPTLGLPWLPKLCLTVAKTALFRVSEAVCISGPRASLAPPLRSAQTGHFLRGLSVYCMHPLPHEKKKQEIHSLWSYWQEKQIMGLGDPKCIFVRVTGMHCRFKWRKSWGGCWEMWEGAGKCGLSDTTWLNAPGTSSSYF